MISVDGGSVSADDVLFVRDGQLVWAESNGDGVPIIKTASSYKSDDELPAVADGLPEEIHIVVNPSAGHGRAPLFAQELLLPLLNLAGLKPIVHETRATDGAKSVVAEVVRQRDNPVIVLCGGDGTTHEAIEGAADSAAQFVLIPVGTACAMYAALFPDAKGPTSQLRSLLAFLRGSEAVPLPLARVRWSPDDSVLVHVVGSFALHASILYDAANDSVPGLDRFKRAAMANLTRAYHGQLRLQSAQLYDLDSRSFKPSDQDVIDGPFSYIASALVDRFEPTFIVAPLRQAGSADGTIDVLVIKHHGASTEEITKVTGAMYDGGKHIDLRSDDGKSLVDYYRVAGLTWLPAEDADLKSRLVCADGAVHEIVGSASVEPISQSNLRLYR